MPPSNADPLDRRFMTIQAVAEMFDLSAPDVESMVVSGELPAIRVGPADEWRIERSVLESFLEAKYEETRRTALWKGFDFASIAEIDPKGRRIPPHSPDPEAL